MCCIFVCVQEMEDKLKAWLGVEVFHKAGTVHTFKEKVTSYIRTCDIKSLILLFVV